MERQQFEQYINEAIALVPPHIRRVMTNVAFVIDDVQVGRLLGLYQGIPLPQRGQGYSGVTPDVITIFQRTIEAVAENNPERIRQMVHETVHHEIAHYFGFSEHKVRDWERRRRIRSSDGPARRP